VIGSVSANAAVATISVAATLASPVLRLNIRNLPFERDSKVRPGLF
jgi:hypothetical protein